ncbi:MAG: Helix-turn-helix domain protein [Spirochaetes bacterium ADurb.Bin215]|nr:MAG: Helix-turn-helix domain protein [Spirochaetes bacterium ADurb.Bin215]
MSDSEVCQVNDSNDEVMDIERAARFLKCGTSTLYRYVCHRSIPCIKMGSRTLFKRSDLLVWLDQYRRDPVGFLPPGRQVS